ncbi:Ig-like domain-containing protein [Pseudomonas siliginis]|uniref:Ig-like domain-containing protein n=1 Tax=Pseudomonas siliginis TaxID=2842346 RepID=UPI002093A34C|nr:Ig-like domain-containing protein [Pseudomonas siliginis]UST72286.1 Ig-like domain-containing protein [Pseudomonas siliginis]
MRVSVSVVDGKTVVLSLDLANAKPGDPVRIKAIKGGKYILAEGAEGFAPENITVKRVGKNLHVALEGGDPDQPQLIIEDFYEYEGQLVGMAEDSTYHEYVAVDGDDDSAVAFLKDGVSSPLALGGAELSGLFGATMLAGGVLPTALLGLGALGLAGGALALGRDKGGKDHGGQGQVDRTPPENNGIGSVVDGQGSIQGELSNGDFTDDGRPVLSGGGQEPGDKVVIIDNGNVIGEVIVDENGNWTFTPEVELEDGEHTLVVVVEDPDGNVSEPSPPTVIIVDTSAPPKPDINAAMDNVGGQQGLIDNGGYTDDTTPTLAGKAEAGSTVRIYDDGSLLGEVVADANGNWSFTPTTPLNNGEHSFTVISEDEAGNKSEPSDEYVVVVDTVVPEKPSIGGVEDNVGEITGPVESGESTDDNQPTLSGEGEPGDTVTIIDNGNVVGEVVVGEDGSWSFTPEEELEDGEHVFEIVVTDPAGNKSEPSDEYVVVVDTVAPEKPSIGGVEDNVGEITGPVESGESTDDNQPTLSGEGEPGDTVTIIDNGNVVGEVVVGEDGSWSFTPEEELEDGEHVFEIVVTDPAGNKSEPSDEYVVVVDTVAPEKPGIGGVEDNVGEITGPVESGESTDDNQPTLSGEGEPGDTVTIIDNGNVVGEVVVGEDGSWSFTPEEELEDGEHVFEIVVTDPAGNKSEPSDEYVVVVDTVAPEKPGIGGVEDNVGEITGPVESGESTDDNQPTLSGEGEPGDTVTIIDNGNVVGEVVVGEDGSWSFTPEEELEDGEHVFEIVVTDPAGNESEPSDEYVVIVDTAVPSAPTIDSVFDDQGDLTGNLTSGEETDDAKPTISGTAEVGSTVVIKDKGVEIGRVQVDENGQWSFEPSLPLSKGDHQLTVEAIDAAGNVSAPSNSFDLVVTNDAPPTAPAITAVMDDVGSIQGNVQKSGVTDDARPTIVGTAQPGMTVSVYIDGVLAGTTLVDAKGDWSFTPSADLIDGLHNITATATSSVGNVSPETGAYPIVVDTVAPATPGDAADELLDDVGQVQGKIVDGTVTDDNTPTFEGIAEPDAVVVIYDNGQEVGRVQTDGEGKWSFTPSTPLVDGEHSLSYEVLDPAGNVSEKSDAIDFTVDTSAVEVIIEGASDNAGEIQGVIAKGGVTDDATPTLHGKATVGGIVKIYDGVTLLGEAVVGADGKWSFTPSVELSEGLHSFTASVTTEANGESEKTAIFDLTVDLAAPAKPLIDSINDDVGSVQGVLSNGQSTDDTTPTLAGKAEAGSTISIYDNGSLLGEVVADANGNWSFTPTTPLNNGEHSFTVVSEDQAGNVSEPSDAYVVVIDTIAPEQPSIGGVEDNVGEITGPVESGESTDDNQPTLSGEGEPGDTVTIIDNGNVVGEVVVGEDGSWSFTPEEELEDGEHVFEIVVTDPAGNESEPSDEYVVIVDTAVPSAPTIDSVFDDQGDLTGNLTSGEETDDAKPTISGTAEVGSTVVIKDKGVEIGRVQVDENGQWSFEPSLPLSKGDHQLTVEAIDAAGNVSAPSNSFDLVVTNDAPPTAPAITAVMDDVGSIQGNVQKSGVTDDARPTIVGTAQPGMTVSVYIDGVLAGTTLVDAKGDWSFTPSADLIDGLHNITATATSSVGNVSPETGAYPIVVDTVAPATPGDAADELLDDVGQVQGKIVDGTVTDDNTPTFEGIAEPDAVVVIYDNGQEVGRVQTDGEGKWSFTPSTPLVDGEHSLSYEVLDPAGNVSEKSDAIDFTVDTSAVEVIIEGASDNAGEIQGVIAKGGVTDDATPTLHGKATVGGIVKIYDGVTLLGEAVVGADGKWSFTPSVELSEGLHSFTASVTTEANGESEKTAIFDLTVDLAAPAKPLIDSINDDVGSVQGVLSNGQSTDDTTPTLAGKAEAGSTISIYDNGSLLGEVVADANGNWSFTPTTPLNNGEHSFTVVSEDQAGNVSEPSDAYVVVIDTIAPEQPSIGGVEDNVGEITGPVESGESTDDNQPTLSGEGEPGDTVTIIDNGNVVGEVVVGEDGSWSFTPEEELEDGEHVFEIVVTDPAGNESEPSDEYVVIVDTAVPSAPTIDSVFDDQGDLTGNLTSGEETDDAKPTISGTAEVGSTVVIKDKGVEIGRVQVDENGQWSFEPSLPLSKGDHQLTVEAIDAAGNVSAPSNSFDLVVTNDAPPTAPAITAVMDDVGSIQGNVQKSGVTDDARPTIVGTAQPGMTVSVYIDGVLAGTTLVDAKGDWSFTPSADLIDGLHNITATATSSVGNVSPETGAYPIVVDTVAPATPGDAADELLDDVGQVQGKIVDGTVTDDNTPTFEGIAEPDAVVVIYDNGQEVGRVQTDGEGKWSFTPSTPLVDGEHSLSYEVLDPAGNVSEKSDAIDFTVDTSAVEVIIEGASDNAGEIQGVIAKGGVTDDATPTLHGKATVGGIVKIYDGVTLLGEAVVGADGKWSFTPSVELSEGLHSFTASVTTEANGESEKTAIFDLTVDLAAPAKPLIDSINDDVGSVQGVLSNGQSTDDTTPTLAGKAEAGSTISIYDNGSLLGEVVADANGNWSFTPTTPLNNGEHSFTVVSEDQAGNVSEPSDAYVVVIDTIAPEQPSIGGVEDNVGEITGPVESGESTDDNQPTLSGEGEPGDTVTIIDNGNVVGEVVVGEDGSWSFTPEEELEDGEHVFEIVVTDPAGNESEPSDEYVVIVDTAVPSAPTIDSVFDDQGDLTGNLTSGEETDDAKPTISGTAEVGSTVVIKDKGVEIGRVQVDENGQWSFEPSLPLSKGDHQLTVEAIDAAGNVSAPSNSFDLVVTNDAPPTAPAITAVMDDVGSIQGNVQKSGVTDDARPTIVGTAQPGMTVSVYIDGVLAGTTLVDAKGDWSFTPSADLIDGLHNITATATSSVGNVSPETGAYPIVVDTVAPATPGDAADELLDDVGQVQGKIVDGTVTDDNTPTFEGIAEPDAVVVIYDNGQEVGRVQTDGEGKWSFTPSTPLVDGEHSLSYEVLDPAGNVSEKSDAIDFTVDTSAVEVIIEGASDNAGEIQGVIAKGGVTDDATPTLHGKATVGGIVKIYDGVTLLGEAVVGADGKWSFTPVTALANGLHNLTATVSTVAQGESTRTPVYALTIDTVAPGAPVITGVLDDVGGWTGNVASGGKTDDANPTINGTAEVGSIVKIYDGATLLGSTMADASGNWSFTPLTNLGEGLHSLTAQATDAAGNTGTGSTPYSIDVDTQRPAAPVIVQVVDDRNPVTGDIGNNGMTNDSRPEIRGTAEAFSTVTIYVSGNPLGVVTADASGNWSWTLNVDLSTGKHTFTADARDALGHTSDKSAPYGIEVDVTAPFPPLFTQVVDNVGGVTGSLVSGETTDDSTPTFHGTSEPNATVEIWAGLGTVLLGTTTVDSSGNWTFTPPVAMSEGWDAVKAITIDPMGNRSGWSLEWEIVIELPMGRSLLSTDGISSDASDETGSAAASATAEPFLFTVQPEAINTLVSHGSENLAAYRDLAVTFGIVDTTGTRLKAGSDILTLSASDVLARGGKDLFHNSGNVQLMVKGDADDLVNLDDLMVGDSGASDWTLLSNVEADGVTYATYHHAAADSELLVQQGVTVNLL